MASCSFDKHGQILIIFGKLHQHTFENDMDVQLSWSLHFYLLYLLLIAATEMTRTDVTMLVKHSIIRKHRTLSFQICVRQTVRLTTEFVD